VKCRPELVPANDASKVYTLSQVQMFEKSSSRILASQIYCLEILSNISVSSHHIAILEVYSFYFCITNEE